MARMVWVAGGAWGKVGKLGGHRLTQHQSARLFQLGDADGLLAGQARGGQPAAGPGLETVDPKDVLHPDRKPKERRPVIRGWKTLLELAEFCVQPFEAPLFWQERVQFRLNRLEPRLQFLPERSIARSERIQDRRERRHHLQPETHCVHLAWGSTWGK